MQITPMTDYKASSNGTRTLEEAVSEVQREIDVRRRLYDRWVTDGRMSRVDAHDRLERLLTALRFLLSLPEGSKPAETPF
jgi:hypothetical protein